MTHNSLVFTADDFGKSDTANKNILALLDRKMLGRISVMVNGQFSKSEITKLSKSKVRLDIHLELPQDHVMHRGLAIRSFLFVWRIIVRKTNPKKIEEEWDKQIKKFKEIFKRFPDGLNSHEHVHFFPPYFKIALKLCKEYKIPHIRFGKKGILDNNSGVGAVLRIFNELNKGLFLSYKLHVSSYMFIVSLDWLKNPEKFLETPPSGTVEIICHPEREEEYARITNSLHLPIL